MMVEDLLAPTTETADIAGLSNFDFTIQDGTEESLARGEVVGYAGWNFYGYVWTVDGGYACDVWRYGAHVRTFVEPDLKSLMVAVSDEYGYE